MATMRARDRVRLVDVWRDGSAWRIGVGREDKARLQHDEDARLALGQRFSQFEAARSTAQHLFPKAHVAATGFRMFGKVGALLGAMWK